MLEVEKDDHYNADDGMYSKTLVLKSKKGVGSEIVKL